MSLFIGLSSLIAIAITVLIVVGLGLYNLLLLLVELVTLIRSRG